LLLLCPLAEGEGKGGRAGAGSEDLLGERVEEEQVGHSELQEGWRVSNRLSLRLSLAEGVFDKSRIYGAGGFEGEGGEGFSVL
jgi:hypothetical protein